MKSHASASLVVLGICGLLLTGVANAATVINSTVISGTQITITGTGFSGTPLLVSFNGKGLSVISSSSTQIIASLNPVPQPGSYRLVVKSGTASTSAYIAVSGFPTIVAQVSLTNQMDSLPLTTLLTPVQTGLYRISINMTGNNTNCSPGSVTLDWTSDGLLRMAQESNVLSYGILSDDIIARTDAGLPLSYSTEIGACTSYDLSITVEQLQ